MEKYIFIYIYIYIYIYIFKCFIYVWRIKIDTSLLLVQLIILSRLSFLTSGWDEFKRCPIFPLSPFSPNWSHLQVNEHLKWPRQRRVVCNQAKIRRNKWDGNSPKRRTLLAVRGIIYWKFCEPTYSWLVLFYCVATFSRTFNAELSLKQFSLTWIHSFVLFKNCSISNNSV